MLNCRGCSLAWLVMCVGIREDQWYYYPLAPCSSGKQISITSEQCIKVLKYHGSMTITNCCWDCSCSCLTVCGLCTLIQICKVCFLTNRASTWSFFYLVPLQVLSGPAAWNGLKQIHLQKWVIHIVPQTGAAGPQFCWNWKWNEKSGWK